MRATALATGYVHPMPSYQGDLTRQAFRLNVAAVFVVSFIWPGMAQAVKSEPHATPPHRWLNPIAEL